MSASRPTVRALYRSVPRTGKGLAAALIVPLVAACAWSVGYDPLVVAGGTLALLLLAHLWLTRPSAVASWLVLTGVVTMSPVIAAAVVTLHGSGSLSLLTAAVALGATLLTVVVTTRAGEAKAGRVILALIVYVLTVIAVAPVTAAWAMLAGLAGGSVAEAALRSHRRPQPSESATRTATTLAAAPAHVRVVRPTRLRGVTPAPEAVLLAPAGVFVLASIDAYAATVTTDPVTVGGHDLTDTVDLLDRQCRAVARALRVGDTDPVTVLVAHRTALTAPAWSTTPAGRTLLIIPGTDLLPTLTGLPEIATDTTLTALSRRLSRTLLPLPW